jgi:membrane fusion protein, multidrug efflux system
MRFTPGPTDKSQHTNLANRGDRIPTMTATRFPDTLTICILLTLSAFGYPGCGSSEKEGPRTGGGIEGSLQIVPVEVAVAERRNMSVTKTYSGTLEGEEQANIVAKISERITSIIARVGQAVPTGQVMINLDKSGSSSQYHQAEANFKNAEKTLERMKSLYGEGAISLQSLDGVQTAFDVAKANFEGARSTVDLTTPISGVVTAVNVSNGDMTIPGAVLATVAKISRMKVIFTISENDVPRLALGQKVSVYSDTRSDVVVVGRIVQLSKSADIRSRSFEVKAMFLNTSDRWFKPGMFCKVDVQLPPRAGALAIPSAAIQSDGVISHVYVVHNGRAFRRVVHLGVTDGHDSEILQGLAEFDTVATVGATTVKDSGFVSIVHPSK